jgi:DnaJ-class molecular chaperone
MRNDQNYIGKLNVPQPCGACYGTGTKQSNGGAGDRTCRHCAGTGVLVPEQYAETDAPAE